MGARLVSFFDKAGLIGGVRAKVRLAVLTGLTTTQAQSTDDSTPGLVETVANALRQLEREFQDSSKAISIDPAPPTREDANVRRHVNVFLELMTQRSLFLSEASATFARITEAASHTLNVARVGVWLFDDGHAKIVCRDLFERDKNVHSRGTELSARDYPAYFRAVSEDRTIAAHDVVNDPRTREFKDAYLVPNGITSMLDVPIWASNRLVGIICHEHTGPMRTWNQDEENFAYFMAGFASIALERRSGA